MAADAGSTGDDSAQHAGERAAAPRPIHEPRVGGSEPRDGASCARGFRAVRAAKGPRTSTRAHTLVQDAAMSSAPRHRRSQHPGRRCSWTATGPRVQPAGAQSCPRARGAGPRPLSGRLDPPRPERPSRRADRRTRGSLGAGRAARRYGFVVRLGGCTAAIGRVRPS